VRLTRVKSLNIIICCGRVGRTLGRLWQAKGCYRIEGVVTHSVQTAQEAVDFMGAGQAVASLAELPAADVWMLAVPDDRLAAAALALVQRQGQAVARWNATVGVAYQALSQLAAKLAIH
jgi:predicted dinucleotide-binding enzyme